MPRTADVLPWVAAIALAVAVLLSIEPSGAVAQDQAPSAPEQSAPPSGGEGSAGGTDDDNKDPPPLPPRTPEREGREDRQDRQDSEDRQDRQDLVEHKGFGQSRRADRFEIEDDVQLRLTARRPVAAANTEQDVIICMAGCDGPPGEVISRRKTRAGGSVE